MRNINAKELKELAEYHAKKGHRDLVQKYKQEEEEYQREQSRD